MLKNKVTKYSRH